MMLAASRIAAPMRVLIVSEEEVESLLTMRECSEVMEKALASLARGEVHQPLRHAIRPPGAPGLLGLIPSWGPRSSVLGPRIQANETEDQGPRTEDTSYY